MKYDSRMKYKWDNKNVKEYLVKQTEIKKATEIAKALKKEGLSSDFISRTTGLSIEEIEKL